MAQEEPDRVIGGSNDVADPVVRVIGATRMRAPLRRRALAALIALGVVAVLGIGWLADGIAMSPQVGTVGPMTRQAGNLSLSLVVHPLPIRARAAEALSVRVVDAAGKPVSDARVECRLGMSQMGMAEPVIVGSASGQAGVYVCDTRLPEAGAWTLDVTVTPRSGASAQVSFPLSVT